MAKVLILSLAPEDEGNNSYHRGVFKQLRESAKHDIFKLHSLTDDPASADLILFAEIDGVGPYYEEVRRHAYVKKFREKLVL